MKIIQFSLVAVLGFLAAGCSNLTDLTTPEASSAVAVPNVTYSVTYKGNGNTSGTAPTDSAKYKSEALVSLATSGDLAKTGNYFNGWKTSASGGTPYDPGTSLVMQQKNLILYADWQPKRGVSYDGNGKTSGSVPTDSTAYSRNDVVAVPGNTGGLVKAGSGFFYNFIGWNTKADGTGTNYAGGSSFKMGASEIVLYALWSVTPAYIVTYVGNGGTGGLPPSDSNLYKAGASVTVLGNTGGLARTAYDFAGWNTAADGSGTAYAAGAVFTMGSGNVILYAKWTLKPTYSVAYVGNGNTNGTVPVDGSSYWQGQTVTVSGDTGFLYKIDGATTAYRFAGWNTQSNGLGTSYAAGSSLTVGSTDVTLFAQYAACAVRDIGPGGGYIFYDKGAYDNSPSGVGANWRYIEAAPAEAELSARQNDFNGGDNGSPISGTYAAVGYGLENTTHLAADLFTPYGGGTPRSFSATSPAGACYALVYNGFDDWFLPSEGEMLLIYSILKLSGLGGIQNNAHYWDSYWGDSWDVTGFVYTGDGTASYMYNTNGALSRPARRF